MSTPCKTLFDHMNSPFEGEKRMSMKNEGGIHVKFIQKNRAMLAAILFSVGMCIQLLADPSVYAIAMICHAGGYA